MKRISLFLILIVIGINNELKAQTFNSVVDTTFTSDFSFTGGGKYTMGTFTIPSATVWKVETSSYMVFRNSATSFPNATILIDNHAIFHKYSYTTAGSSAGSGIINGQILPLWLSEGTYTIFICLPSSNPNVYTHTVTMSAIEFLTP